MAEFTKRVCVCLCTTQVPILPKDDVASWSRRGRDNAPQCVFLITAVQVRFTEHVVFMYEHVVFLYEHVVFLYEHVVCL
jgi:hypothetical protein